MNIEKFYYDEQTEMYEQMKKEQACFIAHDCRKILRTYQNIFQVTIYRLSIESERNSMF